METTGGLVNGAIAMAATITMATVTATNKKRAIQLPVFLCLSSIRSRLWSLLSARS